MTSNTPGHDHDPELRRLMDDAVKDINPHEGISAIRARTKKSKENTMPARRSTLLGAAGAALAVAAVIGVIVGTGALGGDKDNKDTSPAATPGGTPSATVNDPTPETEPSEPTEPPTTDEPAGHAVPVYYVGDGPRGPVLFREFQSNPSDDDAVYAAVNAAVTGSPNDPDYRSAWPEGITVVSTAATNDLLVVVLDGDLRERPAGLNAKEAELAIEQVIRSAQGAYGQGPVPVSLVSDGNPIDQVLGVPTAEPLAAGKVTETLSLMSISSPSEGAVVSGKFTATGVNNGFEAWVGYQILKDGEEVATGFGMAEGWMEEKLFPWEVEVDVSGLEPGEYVLRFHNDDPSGGTEGFGPDEDTRTIIVE